ncbi:TPA: AAA family ATPase, partial [Listeria monocytogenes]|nr:AAA family ATPase [Listeria monocytogenes]
MTAKIYVIGNFKGGVGKSTSAQMLGFESAIKKQKTLLIDLDMQGNTSDVMNLTHMNFSDDDEVIEYENTITDVLINGTPPEQAVYSVIENLDILPADMSFEIYDDWIKKNFPESIDQFQYMQKRL